MINNKIKKEINIDHHVVSFICLSDELSKRLISGHRLAKILKKDPKEISLINHGHKCRVRTAKRILEVLGITFEEALERRMITKPIKIIPNPLGPPKRGKKDEQS